MSKLTPKQERFCQEYIIDLNAKQAAIRSGYSERSAEVTGCRLISNAKVRDRIQELADRRSSRAELTADRVLQELMRIAFLDPMSLLNEDGSMKKMSEIPEDARRAIAGLEILEKRLGDDASATLAKLKISDKGAALERLGKHLGIFADRVRHEFPDDLTFIIEVPEGNGRSKNKIYG